MSQRTPEEMLAAFRTATLNHEHVAQEVCLNELLRYYIANNLFQQADNLVDNTKNQLSQPFVSNNQAARYFYYLGRIAAAQLEYSHANECFAQAFRKAPDRAVGFKTIVSKFQVLIQLLMGEIPVRSTFMQPESRSAMEAYLDICSAVRFGQLQRFHESLEDKADVFRADGTLTLVQRIRQVVIKTALHRIITAYTRIKISDICYKLSLDSEEDAEMIVAKAIKDGVIDATIDHQAGVVTSRDVADIYSTPDPAAVFARRTAHLNKVHNQAMKAMRYLPEEDDDDADEAEESRKRRAEDQEALEQALEEEDSLA